MGHYGYSSPHLTDLKITYLGGSQCEGEQGGLSSARYDELDANFPLIVFHQWLQKFS